MPFTTFTIFKFLYIEKFYKIYICLPSKMMNLMR